jgi:hypothetical protein
MSKRYGCFDQQKLLPGVHEQRMTEHGPLVSPSCVHIKLFRDKIIFPLDNETLPGASMVNPDQV